MLSRENAFETDRVPRTMLHVEVTVACTLYCRTSLHSAKASSRFCGTHDLDVIDIRPLLKLYAHRYDGLVRLVEE